MIVSETITRCIIFKDEDGTEARLTVEDGKVESLIIDCGDDKIVLGEEDMALIFKVLEYYSKGDQ